MQYPSITIMLLSLMLHIFLLIMPSSCKGCFQAERAALLDFKAGITDDPSHRLSSWKVDEDCCRWNGVVCDNQTGHVVELNLQHDDYYLSGLRGDFLNRSLLSLTHLDRLNLSNNDFGGIQIPEFMGSFPKLRYLDLSNSNFSSKIPSQLGNLSTLLYLDLSSWETRADRLDWLSGLSSLRYLSMEGVDLSEADHEWLPMVNMLPSLHELNLRYCGLQTLSSSLSYESLNLTVLTILDLDGNNFNSTLPTWLWKLSTLSYLVLGDNYLSSIIPHGIGNLTSLTYLDICYNYLYGVIPFEIWNLTSLTNLYLEENNLETLFSTHTNRKGELLSLQPLTRLSHVDLRNNLLSGDLATWLLHMTTTNYHNNSSKFSNLNYLDLSNNNLHGNLTELHFAKLTRLETLFLFANSQITINAIDDNWIPPFQLQYIELASCVLGPKFPRWLHSQKSIVHLDLSNSSIHDALPDWLLSSHTNSRHINLSNNRIRGSLPTSLTNLTNLYYLNLSCNLFNGSISSFPPNMGVLDLSDNALWGQLPSTFPSSLSFLSLSSNYINGSMPLELCNLEDLEVLNLENNQISGEISRCWGEAAKRLRYINLGNNNLSGVIPSAIGSLLQLELLQLNNNSLHGLIPLSLQNCSMLTILDIGDNKLSGNVPSWIGQSFPHLQVLRLSSNMFFGNIPPEIGQLSHLQIIDFANNKLSGFIPPSFGNFNAIINMSETMNSTQFGFYVSDSDARPYELSAIAIISINTKGLTYSYSTNVKYMKSIDLSNNNLFGNIPQRIGALLGLQNLNLSVNNLQGEIPDSIGNMKSLGSLDLSFNKLSGIIPQSLAQLNSLEHLNMSYNNLSGQIPSGNQLQTLVDPSIYVGNTYLCGPPLSNSCSINDKNATEEANYSEKLWHYLSMIVGFVVGLWSVFVVLLFKNDWRIFYFRLIDNIYDEIYVRIVVTYTRFRRKLNGAEPRSLMR